MRDFLSANWTTGFMASSYLNYNFLHKHKTSSHILLADDCKIMSKFSMELVAVPRKVIVCKDLILMKQYDDDDYDDNDDACYMHNKCS